jgi:hypothetical protein
MHYLIASPDGQRFFGLTTRISGGLITTYPVMTRERDEALQIASRRLAEWLIDQHHHSFCQAHGLTEILEEA